MLGLTVNNTHLHRVLEPLAYHLDYCWWYLGGAGMSFPAIRPPKRVEVPKSTKLSEGVAEFDPADWQRYLDESNAASREYANWLTDLDFASYRVGKPGFFRRYASGMDGNWAMYCASDAGELPLPSFDVFASRFEGHWFVQAPDDLPPDICLITRDIDSAYLDVFFRDEWMHKSVWSFCEAKGMKPRRFQRKDLGNQRGR
jgi:hypothetical protein